MDTHKVCDDHRHRLACVYVRQSTAEQVIDHVQSQEIQYLLVERAAEMGWSSEHIMVIDNDQGISGSGFYSRTGFEDLVSLVGQGKVGIVLSFQASRLARNNRDWYHLLDFCSIVGTLIADREGIYDPTRYNDRLLLGLKGTMSEVELHLMKQRLQEGVLHKAKKGELVRRLPPGFIWDSAGRIVKTPDSRVAKAISLVFERFSEFRVVHQVTNSLLDDSIQVPVAGKKLDDPCQWKMASYARVKRILTNPVYAGGYVHGRTETVRTINDEGRLCVVRRQLPRDQWKVVLWDNHSGYISHDNYNDIQQQITANRQGGPHRGPAGEGPALLQGLVHCGRCGRKMSVHYVSGKATFRYCCKQALKQGVGPLCQAFGGYYMEQAVVKLFLEVVSPLGLKASLEALDYLQDHNERIIEQWRMKVEHARYEVSVAERSYKAVDPENRLVASELEKRWENRLKELHRVEFESRQRIENLEKPLSAAERFSIYETCQDIAQVWSSSTTTSSDRKRLLRCLIEQVTVTIPEEGENVSGEIWWEGGARSEFHFRRGTTGKHRYCTEPELITLVQKLAGEFSDEQIARILARRRIRTSKDLPFTTVRVNRFRKHHRIRQGKQVPKGDDHSYTVQQAAKLLRVDRSTLVRWIHDGLVKASQCTEGAPWRVYLPEEQIRALTASDAPRGWLGLIDASKKLGIDKNKLLRLVQSGKVPAVRVRVGKKTAWRIDVNATSYGKQYTIFQ